MIFERSEKGSRLHPDDQRHVLAAFIHRYTGDHRPEWSRDVKTVKYELQFRDDQDWLEHTEFAVKKDGRIDHRFNHCFSTPTWPNRSKDDA